MTKKAASRTGNKGLSLIEMLVAVAVFSAGAVWVLPIFFKSSDALLHLGGRVPAELVMNNVFVDAQAALRKSRDLTEWPARGDVEMAGRWYHYEVDIFSEDIARRVYQLRARVEWDEERKHRIAGTALVAT